MPGEFTDRGVYTGSLVPKAETGIPVYDSKEASVDSEYYRLRQRVRDRKTEHLGIPDVESLERGEVVKTFEEILKRLQEEYETARSFYHTFWVGKGQRDEEIDQLLYDHSEGARFNPSALLSKIYRQKEDRAPIFNLTEFHDEILDTAQRIQEVYTSLDRLDAERVEAQR